MKKFILFSVVAFVASSLLNSQTFTTSGIREETWGDVSGKIVKLFTLTNKNGMVVKVTNYGGTLVSVIAPDRNGIFEDVALGFDSLKNYLGMNPMFGATVGRFANRIGGAQFVLNGTTYKLNTMGGGTVAMHGGLKGFNRQVFEIDQAYAKGDSAVVVLHYLSADMEEGYPGNLKFQLTFLLNGNNEVKLEYQAVTDKPTVINFTNHSYFNLNGGKESVLKHLVMLNADSITPTDKLQVPTGEIKPVKGSAYDFTKPHEIGERIGEVDPGYDINYKLNKKGSELSLVAIVYDQASGRTMEAYTTEPGFQFFTANSLSERFIGHHGMKYGKYFGYCLEMQHFPDSPNKPMFPNVVLNPGEVYHQTTIYKLSAR
jgi:aldose 1-epimerase